MVRDSAGIAIVESFDSTWTTADRMRVAATPSLTLGCRSCDDPNRLFAGISDVFRLRDGRIVVVELVPASVRVFEANGTFAHEISRTGPGPGEFAAPTRGASLRGDSIVIHDTGHFTQHVFSVEGDYARSVRDSQTPDWRNIWDLPRAWLPDGSYLIADEILSSELPPERGIAFAEWRIMSPLGDRWASVGPLPARHGKRSGSFNGYPLDGFTALAPAESWGADSTGLWHAFPTSYELRHYGMNGSLDRIVRRAWRPQPVTRSLMDAFRDQRRSEARAKRSPVARVRELHEADILEFADTLPAFRRFLVTDEGGLWVQDYPAPDEVDMTLPSSRYGLQGPPHWSVFNPEGRWLGTIVVPEGLTIHQIGADFLLGVERDELDVPFVHLYRLERGEVL